MINALNTGMSGYYDIRVIDKKTGEIKREYNRIPNKINLRNIEHLENGGSFSLMLCKEALEDAPYVDKEYIKTALYKKPTEPYETLAEVDKWILSNEEARRLSTRYTEIRQDNERYGVTETVWTTSIDTGKVSGVYRGIAAGYVHTEKLANMFMVREHSFPNWHARHSAFQEWLDENYHLVTLPGAPRIVSEQSYLDLRRELGWGLQGERDQFNYTHLARDTIDVGNYYANPVAIDLEVFSQTDIIDSNGDKTFIEFDADNERLQINYTYYQWVKISNLPSGTITIDGKNYNWSLKHELDTRQKYGLSVYGQYDEKIPYTGRAWETDKKVIDGNKVKRTTTLRSHHTSDNVARNRPTTFTFLFNRNKFTFTLTPSFYKPLDLQVDFTFEWWATTGQTLPNMSRYRWIE